MISELLGIYETPNHQFQRTGFGGLRPLARAAELSVEPVEKVPDAAE